MTPEEHYQKAEELIESASKLSKHVSDAVKDSFVTNEQVFAWQTSISQWLALAQVHATLATATVATKTDHIHVQRPSKEEALEQARVEERDKISSKAWKILTEHTNWSPSDTTMSSIVTVIQEEMKRSVPRARKMKNLEEKFYLLSGSRDIAFHLAKAFMEEGL